MSNFWVYENWTHKRARVHRGDCSYCNDGHGTQPSDSGRNGKWHGPFSDRASAFATAERLKEADTKACYTCGP
jgi:hypothetical protein